MAHVHTCSPSFASKISNCPPPPLVDNIQWPSPFLVAMATVYPWAPGWGSISSALVPTSTVFVDLSYATGVDTSVIIYHKQRLLVLILCWIFLLISNLHVLKIKAPILVQEILSLTFVNWLSSITCKQAGRGRRRRDGEDVQRGIMGENWGGWPLVGQFLLAAITPVPSIAIFIHVISI